ncbi:MAG: hypothetical protein JKX70_01720 [Phycisphaerales bacterium]|nr:hypothetical protein [Phycisphaerales bacterium]
MSDLGFALDGLYASGWWPNDGDRCLQSSDGRWYPSEALMLEFFAQSIIRPTIRQSSVSSAVEVVWSSPKRGRQSVHGRSREEALILAFTSLYQETHTQIPSY